MNEDNCDSDESDTENAQRRKFSKQTHPKVFDLQGQTTDQQGSQVTPGITVDRADPPKLLHTAIDTSNGSTANLTPTAEEQAAMYD